MSQESQTVGNLIDELLRLRRHKLETTEQAQEHLRTLIDAEDAVQLSLSCYGPVVHNGEVWWTYLPPRTGRLGRAVVHVEASKLPWPPVREVAPEPPKPKSEPMPEKIAGFIPPREMDK